MSGFWKIAAATEALITDIPEPEAPMPPPGGGMGGGMGGMM